MEQTDVKQLVISLLSKGHKIKLKASGISMFPLLWPNTMLDIIPYTTSNLKVGDIAVFNCFESNTLVAHRIIKIDRNAILFRGDSCPRTDGWINAQLVLGKVTRAQHRHISYNIDNYFFRLYGHLVILLSPLSHNINRFLAIFALKMNNILKTFIR